MERLSSPLFFPLDSLNSRLKGTGVVLNRTSLLARVKNNGAEYKEKLMAWNTGKDRKYIDKFKKIRLNIREVTKFKVAPALKERGRLESLVDWERRIPLPIPPGDQF